LVSKREKKTKKKMKIMNDIFLNFTSLLNLGADVLFEVKYKNLRNFFSSA
jgi:hypothetical protein